MIAEIFQRKVRAAKDTTVANGNREIILGKVPQKRYRLLIFREVRVKGVR